MNKWLGAIITVSFVGIVGLGVLAWQTRHPAAPPRATTPPAPSEPVAPLSVPVPASPEPPRVEHPIEPAAQAPIATPRDLERALGTLLGRTALEAFVHSDDFAHRFVATVDNLGRAHASVLLWPVRPTSGMFTVDTHATPAVIAATNARRYAPFVRFVESVDTRQAVDLYVRAYPQLQQAYEQLGYPGRYFNDRVIEVLDQLIATPQPSGPLAVELTDVKGPIPSERPWVRYQYIDPALESRTSGQRILLRVGADNERRLQAKLREVRQALIDHAPKR